MLEGITLPPFKCPLECSGIRMLDGQVSDAVEAREGIINTSDFPSILVKVIKDTSNSEFLYCNLPLYR